MRLFIIFTGLLWFGVVELPPSLKELWRACSEFCRRGEQLIAPAFRFALLVSLLWMGTLASRADTHYVSLNGTNDIGHSYSNDWAGAATNIQWAVDVSIANDTVLVSNGTYYLTNEICIAKSITVRSLNGTNSTFVNGNYPAYSNRCFVISNAASAILDGFTISNGYIVGTTATEGGGGGVRIITAGSVINCFIYKNTSSNISGYFAGGGAYLNGGVISNCNIISNSCLGAYTVGGGIHANGGSALIIDSRISGNQGGSGSGAGIYTDWSVTIDGCTVDNNNGDGGIYISRTAIVTDCIISNNTGVGNGGGIKAGGTATRLLNSIITRNTALYHGGGVLGSGLISNCIITANTCGQYGGGLEFASTNTVINCTIAGNVAAGYLGIGGGGVYFSGGGKLINCLVYGNTNASYGGGGVYIKGTGVVVNCTIANNQAEKLGGGLFTTNAGAYITNCIIYGNVTTNDNCDEVYNSTEGETNNFWYNCTPTNLVAGQGNITNNPLFIDAVNRNYRLSSGSPCINTGKNLDWMTNSIDLEGRVRIRYGRVDMGAYEAIYSGTMYMFR